MQRSFRAAVVAAMVATAGACAGPRVALALEEEGSVLLTQPQSVATFGVTATALLTPCDPASPLQGLDGHWVALPDLEGCTATIERIDAFTEPAALFFGPFNASDCVVLEDAVVTNESPRRVPDGTTHALVYLQANSLPVASFRFSVDEGGCDVPVGD